MRNIVDPTCDHVYTSPARVCSHDSALAAIAEVGALRLNASRGIISFFDRRRQYVLAEATRDLDTELWLGACVVPRGNSCCEHTAELQSILEQGNSLSGINITVIPDLREHETFCQKDFVLKSPFGRFYAGIPIRTQKGFNIGAYCVLDDQPRPGGLTTTETEYLRKTGLAIMNYMEQVKSAADYKRAGRMVRGLGNFASGKPLSKDCRTTTSVSSHSSHSSHRRLRSETSMNTSRRTTQPQHKSKDYTDSLSATLLNATVLENHPRREIGGSSGPRKTSSDPHKSIHSSEIVATFERAVEHVRDAIDVDGVLIVDASISSFGGLVDSRRQTPSDISDITDPFMRSGSSTINHTPVYTPDGTDESDPFSVDKKCDVLGLSISHRNAIPNPDVGEQFVQSLLQRYPSGKIWCFDEDEIEGDHGFPNSLSSTDLLIWDDMLNHGINRQGQRRAERKTLRKLFPGARCLAFVGLRDAQRNCHFAASLIWTYDPMFIMTADKELGYLQAFGDTIMAEIAQLKVKSADKAKADFISSISHELRSPLHGILGSVECLKEDSLDALQQDLLRTIATCGTTLLDTMEHLLDFAKINRFVSSSNSTSSAKDRDGRPAGLIRGVSSLESDVDLSMLVEQAVESVCAGHAFLSASTSMTGVESDASSALQQARTTGKGSFSLNGHRSEKAISIGFAISKKKGVSYAFRTSAGGWRRIVLNIVGNSLKYTKYGHVKVKLDAEDLAPDTSSEGLSRVTFTVSDTGKGISEGFLREKLFEPFAQEDSLVPGTGLGMSLCKHIVAELGGKMEVRSKLGKGTTVVITVDLEKSSSDKEHIDLDNSDLFSKAAALCQNKCFNFFGMDIEDNSDRTRATASCLGQVCKSWFNMDFTTSLSVADADIYMTTRDVIERLLASEDALLKAEECSFLAKKPLIVLCNTAASAYEFQTHKRPHTFMNSMFRCISQPCGPRKIAEALKLCLEPRPATKVLTVEETVEIKTASIDVRQNSLTRPSIGAYITTSLASLEIASSFVPPPDSKRPIESSPVAAATSPISLSSISPLISQEHLSSDGNTSKPSAQEAQSDTARELEDFRVLLVDDNAINLKLLVMLMNKTGHSYATAMNGLEALKTYVGAASLPCSSDSQSEAGADEKGATMSTTGSSTIPIKPFSFILMDINMPIMDGLESAREIRAFERQHGLCPAQIVAVTGLASGSAQQEAYGSGIDLFLTKPVRLGKLKEMIDSFILRRREVKKGEEPGQLS